MGWGGFGWGLGHSGRGGEGEQGLSQGPRWAVPLPEDPTHAPEASPAGSGGLPWSRVLCAQGVRLILAAGLALGFLCMKPPLPPLQTHIGSACPPLGDGPGTPGSERRAEPTLGAPPGWQRRPGGCVEGKATGRIRLLLSGVTVAAGPPRAKCPCRAGQSWSRLGHPQRVPLAKGPECPPCSGNGTIREKNEMVPGKQGAERAHPGDTCCGPRVGGSQGGTRPARPAPCPPRPPLPYLIRPGPRLGHGPHRGLLSPEVDPPHLRPPQGASGGRLPGLTTGASSWAVWDSRLRAGRLLPGRGRAAFYAPSRVNQDWDGPFPAGLPVCVPR